MLPEGCVYTPFLLLANMRATLATAAHTIIKRCGSMRPRVLMPLHDPPRPKASP